MHKNYSTWPALQNLLAEPPALSPGVIQLVVAIADRSDLPFRLAKMATVLRDKGQKNDGLRLAAIAEALEPENGHVRLYTEWARRRQAPLWHFSIIHDSLRNEVYARALAHFVKPGMIVFEIGTGTGILSMLAVRAGARHVYTCERRPDVAEAARAIIARNQMSDRITVISKSAEQMELGIDLPERADLFVAEIVDSGLLGEYVLPLTELARREFLKPDAILLPSRVATRGFLISGKGQSQRYRMDHVMGFDLTPFNRFQPMEIEGVRGGGVVEPLSEAMELMGFDLRADAPRELSVPVSLKVSQSGRAEAVMRWLHLDFGDGITYENAPPIPSSWFPRLHVFPQGMQVEAGAVVELMVEHSYTALYVSPTEVSA